MTCIRHRWYPESVTGAGSFDVLVIGSGASGLAAAVSAERAGARVGLATKGSIQACNSAKAQGGIQAVVRRRRLARAARGGRLQELARQRRHAARRDPHRRRAERDPLARGARSRVHEGERRLPPRPLRRRVSAKRLLQVGDRTGHAITKALREAFEAGGGTLFANSPLTALEPARERLARDAAASTSSTRRRSCSRPAAAASGSREERGELSTNHPNATGEVTQIALGVGAEARDLDELQYHPNGGAWPETMQGYSIPETTRAYGAVLLNADGEEFTDSLGPRDVVSQAIFDEVAKGKGVETDGRPARRLPRHDADRGGRRGGLAAVHAAALPRRGHRPARGEDLTYPVLHYQNGGLDDRHRLADDARGRSTPAARSPAARTAATA